MVKTAFPLAKSPIEAPQEWSLVAQNWLNTGVIKGKLNELQAYADSTGMQVKVKSGQANLQGHFFQSNAEEVMPISASDATNSRIDRIIVRIDWNSDTLDLAILQGVPAASPIAPALTQNTSRWEISLAQINVNAAVATIAAEDVVDERQYASAKPSLVLSRNGWASFTIAANTYTKVTLKEDSRKNMGYDANASQIVIPESGFYQFDSYALVAGTAAGSNVYSYLWSVTKSISKGFDQRPNINGSQALNGATILYCEKGEVLEFQIQNLSSTTVTVSRAEFECIKVGD